MKKNRYYLIMTLFTLFSLKSLACSCIGEENTREAIRSSSIVFEGTIESIDTIQDPYHTGSKSKKLKVVFNASKVYKGPRVQEIVVYTGFGGGDCGYPFKVGSIYFVYGDKRIKDKTNMTYQTDICSRTTKNYLGETRNVPVLRKIIAKSW